MKRTAYAVISVLLMSLMAAPACSAGEKSEFKKPVVGEHIKRGGPGSEVGIPHGRWWKRDKVQEKLGLTDKQIAKLDAISVVGRKKMIRNHADIEVLTLDLEPILDAKTFDRAAAENIFSKIEAIRAEAAKVRIAELLDMREVLTQEQFLKLKEIKGKQGKGGKRGGKQGGR